MKLVRATKNSKIKRIRIRELGRIANEGETFEVTDERYTILSGKNSFRVPFVTLVKDLSQDTVVKKQEVHTEESSLSIPQPQETVNIAPVVDEVPEIYVIEPGKEPVKVDENLEPIVERPKKKRKGKKVESNE